MYILIDIELVWIDILVLVLFVNLSISNNTLFLTVYDIPMVSGLDQRVFLIGDEEEFKVGGGLV